MSEDRFDHSRRVGGMTQEIPLEEIRRRFVFAHDLTFDLSAEEFRALLRLCGISQRRLSDLLGRSGQIISLWVNGHEPVPRYASAFLICFARLSPAEQQTVRSVLA